MISARVSHRLSSRAPTTALPKAPPLRAGEVLKRLVSSFDVTTPAVERLLGDADARLSSDEQASLWLWRARADRPLPLFVRLFLLQQPIAAAAARRVFGRATVVALCEGALVRPRGASLEPLVQLSLHGARVVASDPAAVAGHREYVLGPTRATLLLERLTLPLAAPRALDLGTGSGFLALGLASRCEEVLGTDLSSRALAFARLNAVLNGATNVAFTRSDRFAALARARFDLIVGNLPFVLSPHRRYTYRDAGARAGSFLAGVLGQTGRHLVEGGYAQYLAQWAHDDALSDEERFSPWLVATGCDALILRIETEPVDVYAARWSAGPGSLDARERARRLLAWMAFHRRRGTSAVTTGLFTLRRRTARRHFVQSIEAAPDSSGADILSYILSSFRGARH